VAALSIWLLVEVDPEVLLLADLKMEEAEVLVV
jgi:hypothetical protein